MCKGQKGGENGVIFDKNGMDREKKVKKAKNMGVFLRSMKRQERKQIKMPYGAWYPYGILLDFKAYCQGSTRLIPPKSLSWSGRLWLSDKGHFPSGP